MADEVQSPTTLVLNYLKQSGQQPTSANVRRALEANQRDPTLIPGLINDRPATDAEDQAAMAASKQGTGAARQPSGPIQDQSNTARAPGEAAPDRGDPTTSAQPDGGMGPLGLSVLLGVPAAAAMYGASKIPAMGGNVSVPGGSVPAMPDPGAIAPPNPADVQLLQGPPANEAVSPMEAQMQKALAPPQQMIEQSPVAGVQPIGPPGGADTAPPRGPVEPVAPQVPFSSPSPRVAPTAEELAALAARSGRNAGAMRNAAGALRFLRP